MRATRPTPGDSWPSQMLITTEHDPLALLELLWVREAWGLDPEGDAPPPLEITPARLGSADAEWERAWPRLWRECLEHRAVQTGPLLQRLPSTADGSAERAGLLGLVLGPSWHSSFGDDSLGAPFLAWQEERRSAEPDEHAVPLEETPERRSLHALVPAWEAGLTTIVTLPCRGEYTRTVSGSTLVLTARDRRDPGRYEAALRQFAADASR